MRLVEFGGSSGGSHDMVRYSRATRVRLGGGALSQALLPPGRVNKENTENQHRYTGINF